MGGQRGKGGGKKGGNPGVGIDFKKAKHKVGKRLPKAQNETDTNFKARSINLPSQAAITEEKTGIAVNSQNHTLKELLSQVPHYSEKARKHAIEGLKDLFVRHPAELVNHVGLFYTSVVPRMADSDGGVRTALQDLLRSTVAPALDGSVLQPFMPAIMAHVCSAMTHLSTDIRDDALGFLDILMDHCPQLVVSGFLAPCLHHFCDLLSASHRGRSIRAQSTKALLKVVRALCAFLRRAFPQSGPGSASAAASAPAQGGKGHPRPHATLFQDRCAWTPRHLLLHPAAPPAPASTAGDKEVPKPKTPAASPAAASLGSWGVPEGDRVADGSIPGLARRLLGLLSEAWPECAPGELSTTPQLDQAQALVGILQASISIIHNLVLPPGSQAAPTAGGAVGAGGAAAAQEAVAGAAAALAPVADTLLKRLVPHFPVTMPAVRPPQPVLDALVQYNLQACQLLASFLPLHMQIQVQLAQQQQLSQQGAGGPAPPAAGGFKKALLTSTAASPVWVSGLVKYYTGVLKVGVLVPAQGMLSESAGVEGQGGAPGNTAAAGKGAAGAADAGGTSGASAAYKLVLQGVEVAVPLVHHDHARTLLAGVAEFAARLPARATNRAQCLQLQHRLLRAWQRGEVQLDAEQMGTWVSGLPKLLWELGTSNLDTSKLCLHMLHDTARFSSSSGSCTEGVCPPPSPLSDALHALQPQLAPLFALRMPGRPAKKAKLDPQHAKQGGQGGVAAEVLLPGPATKLPEALQQLAVDLLYHLGSLDPTLVKAVVTAVQEQLLAPSVALRAVEVLMLRLHDGEPLAATSLLLTLLFPRTVATPATAPRQGDKVASDGEGQGGAAGDGGKGAANTRGDGAAGPKLSREEELLRSIEVVLRMVEGYIPTPALLAVLSTQLQQLVSQSGPGAVAPLHLYSLLQLSRMAAELGSGSGVCGQGKTPGLPAWLPPMVPQLAVRLCVGAAGSSSTGVSPGLAQSTVLSLVLQQPELGPSVMQAVGAEVQGLVKQEGQGHSKEEGGQGASLEQAVVALASLSTALLRLQPAKATLLKHKQSVRQALGALTNTQQLPTRLSAHTLVSAEIVRLGHAMEEALGALVV